MKKQKLPSLCHEINALTLRKTFLLQLLLSLIRRNIDGSQSRVRGSLSVLHASLPGY